MNRVINDVIEKTYLKLPICRDVVSFPIPNNFLESLTLPNLIWVQNNNCIYDKYFNFFKHNFNNGLWANDIDLATMNSVNKHFYSITSLAYPLKGIFYSIIFRTFQIPILAAQNYIDNKKLNPLIKFLCTSVLVLIPHLIMYRLFSFDVREFFIASITANFVSIMCDLLDHVGWANAIREVNVLSTNKTFQFSSVLSRGLLSSTVNLTASQIAEIISYKIGEKYNIAQILDSNKAKILNCSFPGKQGFLIMSSENNARILTYFLSELGWLAGRLIVDLSVSSFNLAGYIKDLRAPFVTFSLNKSSKKLQTPPAIPAKEVIKTVSKPIIQPPAYAATSSTAVGIYATNDLRTYVEKRNPKKHVLTEEMTIEVVEKVTVSKAAIKDRLDIKGYDSPLILLYGDHVTEATYGIVDCRNKDSAIFIRSLKSGHVGGSAAIKFIGNLNKYEIRPSNTGYRLLGSKRDLFSVLKQLFPLGLAIEIDREINPDGTLSAVLFNQYQKHEDVSKAGKAR